MTACEGGVEMRGKKKKKKDKNTNMKIPSDSVDLFQMALFTHNVSNQTKMNSLSFKALSV